LKLGGAASGYVADCWVRDMHAWAQAEGTPGLWANATGPGAGREAFAELLRVFLELPANYERYKDSIFAEEAGDPADSPIFRFTQFSVKLTAEVYIDARTGIALEKAWDEWFTTELETGECAAVHSMVSRAAFHTGFDYFFVQIRLAREAFQGILLSLCLALVILTLATGNWIMAVYCTFIIFVIVGSIIGFTVLNGWKLGMLESINFVMVPGLAVDYVAHLAEGYIHCPEPDRRSRVRYMLAKVGVSVVSGAVSTLGASAFLFFPVIVFFNKFGTFVFMTIVFSLFFSLCFFPALLTVIGPEGDTGNIYKKCVKRVKILPKPTTPPT